MALDFNNATGAVSGATLSGTTTNSGTISGGTISGATLSGTTTVTGKVASGTTASANTGASVTLGVSPEVSVYTVDQNTTITLPAVPSGATTRHTIVIDLTVSSTYTVTWATTGGDTVKWHAGSAPTLATGGKLNTLRFVAQGGSTVWRGSLDWQEA